MRLGLPQIVICAFAFIGLGINWAKHGEPRTDRYNGWASLISIAVQFYLLYLGGFFN